MIFETDRLLLRPWQDSDAESLYEFAKDPAVGPAAGWPVHTSVDVSREVIRSVLANDSTFAVCLKETGKLIGCVGLISPARAEGAAESEIEIGYWLGVPYWGRGYMPEAVREILRYAFEKLHCTAVWCGYYAGNEKSRRCMEKCGFRYHHTEENKPVELLDEIRTEIFTRLTGEQE